MKETKLFQVDEGDEAVLYAIESGLPLYDTRRTIDRYYVGHPTIEEEEDEANEDWEELRVDDEQ